MKMRMQTGVGRPIAQIFLDTQNRSNVPSLLGVEPIDVCPEPANKSKDTEVQ